MTRPARARALVARVMVSVAAVWAAAPGADSGAARATPRSPLGARVTADSLRWAGRVTRGATDSAIAGLQPAIREARRIGDRPALARLRALEGTAWSLVQRTQPARPPLIEAAALAAGLRDTALEMSVLRRLAYVEGLAGDLDAQAFRAGRLLALARAAGQRRFESTALHSLGWIDLRHGDVARARERLARAVGIARRDRLGLEEASAAVTLGSALMELGEFDAARRTYLRQLEVARAIGAGWLEAQGLNDLGVLAMQIGDPGEAERWYREALALQQRSRQVVEALFTRVNIANCDIDGGRGEEAAAAMREVAAEAERLGARRLRVAALAALAAAEEAQGRRRAAHAAYRGLLDPATGAEPDQMAFAAVLLARGLDLEGRHAEAAAVIDSARRAFGARVSGRERDQLELTAAGYALAAGRHGEALGIARTVAARRNPEAERWARHLEALALERSGRRSDALAAYALATAAWERHRAVPRSNEWRTRISSQGVVHALDLAALLLAWPPERTAEARFEAAYDSLRRFRVRTTLERLRVPGAPGPVPGESSVRSPSLGELRRTVLAPGDLLLEFTVGRERSLLMAVTRDSTRAVWLPGETALDGPIAVARGLVDAPPAPGASADAAAAACASLGALLLGGVADLLAAAATVLVVPDGAVHRVPFELLPAPDRRPLGVARVVAELPDAAFRGGREASAGGDAVRIVTGAPPRAGEPLAGARREADWLRERYAGASRWSAAGRTPQAALSAMRGAAVLHVTGHAELDDRHPWRSGLVLAAAPDREPAGGPAPVPRPAAGPAPPAARSSPPTPARWLTADAIAAGRLDARMAVLSSCATGAGLALKGEGVASLASAFLVAGVPTVVATRWPVDDAATERLMRAFYAELEAGRTAGEALARARERLRRDPPTAHPFYWAGFVLTGDPDTRLALRARPLAGARVALYLVGGLLVGGALALWRRRRLETGGHRGPPAV